MLLNQANIQTLVNKVTSVRESFTSCPSPCISSSISGPRHGQIFGKDSQILIYPPLSSALTVNNNLGQRVIATISSTAIPPDMPTLLMCHFDLCQTYCMRISVLYLLPQMILIYPPLSSALTVNNNLGQRIITTISSAAIPLDIPTLRIC